ncbi:hypothetical protein ACP4OV_016590 [Aristida adscensionis]
MHGDGYVWTSAVRNGKKRRGNREEVSSSEMEQSEMVYSSLFVTITIRSTKRRIK